jgi:NH3-dependent NAD+ synthetase
MELKQVFKTPDGTEFDNKDEALAYIRRPKIKNALMGISGATESIATWLIENQETVEVAFEVGTIRRVTKSERKKLEKSLEALKEVAGNPKLAFLQENAGAVLESFRWPSVKRMDKEAKRVAARNGLMAATENNEALVEWILNNETDVLNAYDAGVEKREINPAAKAALEEYRARKAAERQAQEAAAQQAA